MFNGCVLLDAVAEIEYVRATCKSLTNICHRLLERPSPPQSGLADQDCPALAYLLAAHYPPIQDPPFHLSL